MSSLQGPGEMAERPATEVDWAKVSLPDTWPDAVRWTSLPSILRLLVHPFRKRCSVRLPRDLCGMESIPDYVLQEFHHLPNGNYSNAYTRGYLSGFDLSMLGCMRRIRQNIASQLRGCDSVLDLGCGGGCAAAACRRAGVPDVWGLDPSPYLLRHAAQDHPDVHFAHGVMEKLPFADRRFDGISVCFAFHEIPPERISLALDEISRVLRPGGRLAVAEPSPEQFRTPLLKMVRRHGWRGAYFKALVSLVHEPYLASWHDFPVVAEAAQRSLRLRVECDESPVKWWVFERDA